MVGPRLARQPGPLRDWRLLCIVALSLALHLWGIQRNLPYVPESDEPQIVERAITMASSGNLNPGWFGAPGSTVIYPLTGIFHLWNAAQHSGTLFHPDPNLAITFQNHSWEFYLLGRLLSIAYGVLSIPLIFLIGRHVADESVGLGGALLYACCPVPIFYAQLVRTDSAATFWGLCGLWLILRAADRPLLARHCQAGVAVGLSVASRYFMVTLVALWVLLGFVGVLRAPADARKRLIGGLAAGLVSAGLAFILATPYFALDFVQAIESIRVEARGMHLGSDGLSPLGNLGWYLGSALPATLFWPIAVAAAGAIGLAIYRRQVRALALVAFVAIFLGSISFSPLHWQRWIIPITPVLLILAAYGVKALISRGRGVSRLIERHARPLFVGSIVLLAAWPLAQMVTIDIQQSRKSTRILARDWAVDNIEPQSWIAEEWYAAPLAGTSFFVGQWPWLARTAEPRDYYREGYRYMIVSSSMYDRFYAEPELYPAQVAFYNKLSEQATLLQTFTPSLLRGGPTVKIYQLHP